MTRIITILAVFSLLGMALLPTIESFSRIGIGIPSIPGSEGFVLLATLWVAFLGAILAARDKRLLALSQEAEYSENQPVSLRVLYSNTMTFMLVSVMTYASAGFVMENFAAETKVVPAPFWVVAVIIPIGFALIATSVFMVSPKNNLIRGSMILAVIIVAIMGYFELFTQANFFWMGIILILLSFPMGVPIFAVLGGIAMLILHYNDGTILAIANEAFTLTEKYEYATIPLFALTGYILAEGGAPKRLVGVFHNWFGWMPGGTPIAAALICAFFTALTGGSGVTILALGGLLLPMLREEGYPLGFSIGLITVSGSLGLLFPPSLPLILYGVRGGTAMQLGIDKIFQAAFVPGLILIGLVSLWGIRQSYISKVERSSFNLNRAVKSIWSAKWEVVIPFLILISILTGFTRLVEVAAMSAVYSLIVEVYIYKDLKLDDLYKVVAKCAKFVGGILIIIAMAKALNMAFVDIDFYKTMINWIENNIHNKFVLLLALNIFLLIVGCLMDIFSAIIIIVPLISQLFRSSAFSMFGEFSEGGIAVMLGLQAVHIAVIFIANLELGYITPPVGMNLFLAAYRFDKPLSRIYRATLPYFLILLFGVMVITYVPFVFPGLLPGIESSSTDSDGDGMPDWWEKAYMLNVNEDDSGKDPDKDGVSNLEEYKQDSNPQKSPELDESG